MISKSAFMKFITSLTEDELNNFNVLLPDLPLYSFEKYDKSAFYKIVEFFFSSKFGDRNIGDTVSNLFDELQKFGFNEQAAFNIESIFKLLESVLPKYEYCLSKFYGKSKIEFNLTNVLNECRKEDERRIQKIEQEQDQQAFEEIVGESFDGDMSAFWESTF